MRQAPCGEKNRKPPFQGRFSVFLRESSKLGVFCESFYAIGADLDAGAVHAGPLEVGFLAGLTGGIVVTAQKDTASDHAGTFFAAGAFNGHRRSDKRLAWT